MAKLKVFSAPQGFFETVVAAPSQKAALEAWGTHQNLFAQGMAEVVEDPEIVAAAIASPGQVLRRAAGSTDPFKPAEEAAPPKPPKVAPKPKAKARTATPKPKPRADRGPLTTAERALTAVKAARTRELADLQREREELERREREAERRLDAELARAEKTRAKAEAAFLKAGGVL